LRATAVVAALTCISVSAPAADRQGSSTAPQRPFRAGVDVVTLNVTVADASRRYVTDLGQGDFQVVEDGRPQQITYFRKTGVSLALALLIDTSASMEQSLPIAQEAATGFVRELAAEDLAAVVDFDSRVEIRQEFTSDHDALERAIRKTSAGGSTSLYNAIYIALRELNKTIHGEPMTDPRRRAIIVLSDGEDTSSLISFDEVLDSVTRSDTAVYAIGLVGREPSASVRRSTESEFVLRRLAQQTGGRAFFPTDAKQLVGIYGEIRAELSNQYFLAYESSNPRRDGQFRRIAVRVERPGVVARARPGYYAGR
jgi:Ca-activated chloride channel family protein